MKSKSRRSGSRVPPSALTAVRFTAQLMATDAEHVGRGRHERLLDEPRFGEPATDRRRQIGRPRMTGPHDCSPGCAERRQPRYGRPNIPVADIAEHAADENEVGRESACVGADERRIAVHDLDLVCDTGGGGARPGECNQCRIELHQARPHVGATPMVGHDIDHVPPLSGADAHDADRPGCGVIEHLTHTLLHKAESHRESGVGVLVGLDATAPSVRRHPRPLRRHHRLLPRRRPRRPRRPSPLRPRRPSPRRPRRPRRLRGSPESSPSHRRVNE